MELVDSDDIADVDVADDLSSVDDNDDVIGEPGIEINHPFPDNALVTRRLLEKYGIDVGQVSPVIVFGDARYVLAIRGWGGVRPGFRVGPASQYVVTEVEFAVVSVDQPKHVLFSGTGKAEFAHANRVPSQTNADAMVPTNFPWDAFGVAYQLAEFDALRKVEAWAGSAAFPRKSG